MQEQEFFTVSEVAKMLKVSPDMVSRRFEKEPGVIDLGAPERLHKRRYRVLRIPAAVLNRFPWGSRPSQISSRTCRTQRASV